MTKLTPSEVKLIEDSLFDILVTVCDTTSIDYPSWQILIDRVKKIAECLGPKSVKSVLEREVPCQEERKRGEKE
jgi:hypothetical protein